MSDGKKFPATAADAEAVAREPHSPLSSCTVIDVGTNAGFYTLMSAAYGCTVFGFEIQAMCLDWLTRAAIKDKVPDKIHLFQNPVSSTVKHLRIKYSEEHTCDGNFGFSREDCPNCDHHMFPTERTFNTTTLDSAFSCLFLTAPGADGAVESASTSSSREGSASGGVSNHIAPALLREMLQSHITLLKIDVEGHDLEVIRGARLLLQNQLIRNLIVEIVPTMWPSQSHLHTHLRSHTNTHAQAHVHAGEVYSELLSFGYNARCLTLKGGDSASGNVSSGSGNGDKGDKVRGKGVAVYTKQTAAAFMSHMLRGDCIDWLFAL